MRIASVIIDVAVTSLVRPFDYLVPETLADVAIGCAVSVDFGHRLVVGYVVALSDVDAAGLLERCLETSKLKSLKAVWSEPYFDEKAAELAIWIAHEYLCPLSEAIHLFTPPAASPKVKRVKGEWTLVRPNVGPVDDRWVFPVEDSQYKAPKNAVKQRAILAALACGGMRVVELSLAFGGVNQTLKTLEKHGALRIERRRRIRGAMDSVNPVDTDIVSLSADQKNALSTITRSLNDTNSSKQCTCSPDVIVMDGITGSGKTEVYLRAIAQVLFGGRGAIVLVPEISLTPQTLGRFRARFGDLVAVLHSKLSVGERYDQWDLIRTGSAMVVVGTRLALFAPMTNLGLIIIDEEHDASYKQDCAPRYGTREVAVKLAQLRHATLVLGSATPSIETLVCCQVAKAYASTWTCVRLTKRPSGQPLPPVTVVDMACEFKSGSRSMFSKQLTDALMEVYENGSKAVLLLNKRGFASFLLCRECGYVPECPNCAVSLTYHDSAQQLICHHCDHIESVPARCPVCGSPYLRKFGTGTERVEAELSAILPCDMPVIRMDADTVKGKGGHEKILERFALAPGGILLGTQMIAKGLDFPDVTLVGVINADTTLRLPDFRAPERTYQLLEQVSGRAGRAEKMGRVVVQTYWPKHPAIQAAAAHDRRIFLDKELPVRKELGYPPYTRMANIVVWGKLDSAVRRRATELSLALSSALETAGLHWNILGPAPCVFTKLRGLYRWHILVKAPPHTDFSAVLGPVITAKTKVKGAVHCAVDVDPYDVL